MLAESESTMNNERVYSINIRNDHYAFEMEELLGSKARLRTLRLLAKYPNHAFTKYKICQVTGLKRQIASNHLRRLLEQNLIASRGGTIVRYCFNTHYYRANALREFLSKMLLA
jgi:DNA-binding transcriptional ArsR family regulator